MVEKDTVLSKEVAIAAKLDETGLAVKAKSRAIAAIDRLAGSLFDWPAAYLEGFSDKKRQKDEIERRLRDAQAEVAESQIRGLPELGASLIHDVLKDKARKLANIAGVTIETIDAIRALPRPDHSQENDPDDRPLENIDEDWMNQFGRYAEDASSEKLQQLWGRVLAGEINRPGSFSRHTLRFISDLDKETAENCQLIARHVVNNWIFKDSKWNSSPNFLVTVDMQRLAVLDGVGISPTQSLVIPENGRTVLPGRFYGLLIIGAPGTKLSFPILILTRMGSEIMSLLNVSDEE